MACNYFYKDILIGDEFQLNDFLIRNKDLFEKDYSDTVFQKDLSEETPKKRTITRFLDHIEENKKLQRDAKIKPANNTIDGEVEHTVEKPYIGVTTFLESFKAWDDSPLFPIFVDENYWHRMVILILKVNLLQI